MGKTIVPAVSVILLLAIFAGLVVYMQTSSRFDIARVGIRGTGRIHPETIVEHLNIQPHTNIFQIQLEDIQQKIESMQWVERADVFRNFPNKLSIDIAERVPFALVKLDELYLVDRDGVVLGSLASGSALRLPIITGDFVNDLHLEGENPQLRQALRAIDDILHSSVSFVQNIRKIQIECLENTTFFSNNSSLELRMSLANYQTNLRYLEELLPDIAQDELTAIDLRFTQRIIVTPNKS